MYGTRLMLTGCYINANFPGLVFSTWPMEKDKRMDNADPFKKLWLRPSIALQWKELIKWPRLDVGRMERKAGDGVLLENVSRLGSHTLAATLYYERRSIHFAVTLSTPVCPSDHENLRTFLPHIEQTQLLLGKDLIHCFLWLCCIHCSYPCLHLTWAYQWILHEVGFLLVQIWKTKAWGSVISVSAKISR